MDDFRSMARDPQHRRRFEKLLYLAAKRGDADLVAERLSWGIDPNCRFAKGRTPLIANARGYCPSGATVRALLAGGADPSLIDENGLSALDYARRKLARLQAKPRRQQKSPSLDENNQLRLSPDEQAELEDLRREVHGDQEYMRMWWQERLRAARRVFNDPEQVEKIVEILEEADPRVS
jgi:ankyrin repeat protein